MGKGSRSQVKTYISKGRVTENGEIIKRPEYKISPENDIVNLEGEKVNYSQWEYYMLNKPAGCVSATEDKHFPTVVSFIEDAVRKDLFPVGCSLSPMTVRWLMSFYLRRNMWQKLIMPE